MLKYYNRLIKIEQSKDYVYDLLRSAFDEDKQLHSSPLRLNIFRLFVILSLIQLYRYTPEIFLFSTATFKYTYLAPIRRIGQEYST
jgi:hypothetical protein